MPRTADGTRDDEPLRQRATIVRARSTDRQQIGALLHEDHRLPARVAEERLAVLNARDRDAGREIGTTQNRGLAHVSPSLVLAETLPSGS
jgi:hypothetical protein